MLHKLLLTSAICLLSIPAIAEETPENVDQKSKRHQKMEQRFDEMDLDGNGEINKNEFLAKAEERFAKIDQDNNGSLTKEELRAAKKQMKRKFKKPTEE